MKLTEQRLTCFAHFCSAGWHDGHHQLKRVRASASAGSASIVKFTAPTTRSLVRVMASLSKMRTLRAPWHWACRCACLSHSVAFVSGMPVVAAGDARTMDYDQDKAAAVHQAHQMATVPQECGNCWWGKAAAWELLLRQMVSESAICAGTAHIAVESGLRTAVGCSCIGKCRIGSAP